MKQKPNTPDVMALTNPHDRETALQNSRAGLTVTEVLVCISVIALLLSLVLPAIQQARETSRRTECVNNLKQLGVAVHNLEGATNSFPHPDGHLISLLPHLGQKIGDRQPARSTGSKFAHRRHQGIGRHLATRHDLAEGLGQ